MGRKGTSGREKAQGRAATDASGAASADASVAVPADVSGAAPAGAMPDPSPAPGSVAMADASPAPAVGGEAGEALKVVLATEHYLDSVSKVELARRHGLSRFQVARLLDEARDEGIVRIEIVDPTAAGRDIAPLARQLGVASVTVASSRPGESVRAAIARQVAGLLRAHLREGGRLGVAWSRTLMHLPEALGPLPSADIVQLVGPLTAKGYSTAQSSGLVHALGRHVGGQVWALPTPLIVDSPQVAASLRAMEEVRTALDAADTLDVATVSIGAWSAGASTLWARLRPDEQQRARDAGVVAEISGILLDRDGAVWHSAMEDRVIGVRPDQLRRARVIAAAPAVGHPEAVIAAARSGLVDDLVLAPDLADQVAARLA